MKYRKKPVIIEAFQMTAARKESNIDWPEWLHRAWNKSNNEEGALFGIATEGMHIRTLEGVHIVSDSDYIIQGVKGELYPCKPDIFEMTYEKVEL
jgi:hypothetical protein